MPRRYEIERSEPDASRCDCCGGLTVRLTRFVHRNGDAFAVYYAAYSNHHPDHELAMLISLGEWGEDADPSQRAAFFCRVWPTEESYEVMLDDAAESIWHDVTIMGRLLSREEALQHPWKKSAFEVFDAGVDSNPSLRGFLDRVHCGDPAVPLERNYAMPDDVFALDDLQRKRRTKVEKQFVALDRSRFFVRCLLEIPVEGYDCWRVGVWMEVTKADYDRARKDWDRPAAFLALQFTGLLANDLNTDLGLPFGRGTELRLHVTAPDEAPRAVPVTAEVPRWSTSDFEAYAIARGFL